LEVNKLSVIGANVFALALFIFSRVKAWGIVRIFLGGD
jgi:hypothetical protein